MTQINELVMRIPGISEEQGSRLGNDVAQLVAENLPEGIGNHEIAELKIQMTASQLNGAPGMASSIADQIISKIKLSIYNT
jgi:hypothetical protein